uniref:F-box domain-containing protein n=1 Tax=Caenorhabditis tropicalis TaxID=1561998 RepID=A0A1I7UIE2_9PELO
MTPFLLLNLPHVVLRELWNHFTLYELIILSFCSRKTRQLVKLNYNKSRQSYMGLNGEKEPLELSFRNLVKEYSFLSVRKSTDLKKNKKWEEVSIGGKTVPLVFHSSDEYEIYCEDQQVGITMLVNYIFDVFGKTPNKVWANPPFLWVLELSKRKTDLTIINKPRGADEEEPMSEEEFKYVMKNSWNSNLYISIPKSFLYSGPFENLESFVTSNPLWLSLENLFTMGETISGIVLTKNTNFTIKDINAFIKHWFNNNMRKFRSLFIKIENPTAGELYEGLEDHMITVEQSIHFEGVDLSCYSPAGISVLRRSDGMIAATVEAREGYSLMCVWKDIDSCCQKIETNQPTHGRLRNI